MSVVSPPSVPLMTGASRQNRGFDGGKYLENKKTRKGLLSRRVIAVFSGASGAAISFFPRLLV